MLSLRVPTLPCSARLVDIGAPYLYSSMALLGASWAAFALLGFGSLPLASAQIQGLSLKRDKLLKVVAEVNPPAAGLECSFFLMLVQERVGPVSWIPATSDSSGFGRFRWPEDIL